jgi:hypoxanthine phosphoribosyltransferase
MNEINFSWQETQVLVQRIVDQIREVDKNYDFIIGINRGGLIPSVLLSHILEIPHGVLTVSHYEGKKMLEQVRKDLYISGIISIKSHHNILIVDDIADSGICLRESLIAVKRIDGDANKIDTATLFYKPKSIVKPTYFGKQTEDEDWICFPWKMSAKNVIGV